VDKPSFAPLFWQELAANNPLGRADITEQDARDWFDLVWLVYKEHYPRVRKPNHRLRIANWWIRVGDEEIDKARARGQQMRRTVEAEKLQAAASAAFTTAPLSPRTDLPPMRIARGVARG
jgi:hypothetical protein